MTILFVGGEDLDFTPIGATYNSTGIAISVADGDSNSINFRPAFACCALNPTVSTGDVEPGDVATIVSFIRTQPFNASNLWLTARVTSSSISSFTGTIANPGMINLRDASGVLRLQLQPVNCAVSSPWMLQKVSAAGVTTTLATSGTGLSDSPSIPDKIDWQVNYATAGGAALYINGNQVLTYTGDVTTDGATTLATADFGGLDGPIWAWSEVIIATTDTRMMALASLPPAAAGATSHWTGSDANLKGIAYSNRSGINTATAGAVQQLTTATALPAGAWSVIGSSAPRGPPPSWDRRSTSISASASVAPTTSRPTRRSVAATAASPIPGPSTLRPVSPGRPRTWPAVSSDCR